MSAALLNVSFVFEQSNAYKGYLMVVNDPDPLKDMAPDYPRSRLASIQNQFREYRDQGIFAPQFVDLILTEEEEDRLTQALLDLLDGDPDVAASAASTLFICGRLYAVPKLIDVMRRTAAMEPEVARAA